MARFSFSIPDEVAEMLDKDLEGTGKSRSSLIAEYIEQHYKGKAQLAEHVNAVQRAKSEHEKRVQRLIAEHAAEVQQIRAECEKRIEDLKADSAASTQQLEDDVERLEKIVEKFEHDFKASEERTASAVERLRQSEASKQTVETVLQHEIELLRVKVTNLEEAMHTERAHLSEISRDKDDLKKQLELVTLRLPAPKEGFWSRVFGRRKKEKRT